MIRASCAILAAALLSGCASGFNRPVSSVDAPSDAIGVQKVDLDLHSFYFEPNRIVVHTGRPVDIALRNRSILVPHNFSIDNAALKVDVNKWGPGTAHARFTAPAPGEYRFFCDVDGHGKKKGMAGTLVVVP
jgi:plastocyanin